VSQPTLEHLDAEVRRILDEEEAEASAILTNQRPILDHLVQALLSYETVQGADLHDLLRGVVPHVRSARNGGGAPAPSSRRKPTAGA